MDLTSMKSGKREFNKVSHNKQIEYSRYVKKNKYYTIYTNQTLSILIIH